MQMLKNWLHWNCLPQKKYPNTCGKLRSILLYIYPFLFVLLVGCCNDQYSTKLEKMLILKNIAWISSQSTVEEGMTFQISQSAASIDVTNESIFPNGYSFDSDGQTSGCTYLGYFNGHHVISRYCYNTFGTSRYSDITLCSTDGKALRIDKLLLCGDRGIDGIEDCSLTEDGRILVDMHLSIHTLARICGVIEDSKNEPWQTHLDYWNVSKCEYNLTNDKLSLIAISITPYDSGSDVMQILKKAIPNLSDRQVNIGTNDISDFLRDFKLAYLLYCSNRKKEQEGIQET